MTDEEKMKVAINEAKKALKKNEVPIGAAIFLNNTLIAKAHNNREKSQNAIAHAEVLAIKKACKKLESWRLDGCELFVSLEPCMMCSGACLNARIAKVVFGASDTSQNIAATKLSQTVKDGRMIVSSLNHNTEIVGGCLEEECKEILQKFFKDKRKKGTKE